jgi:ribose transport system ATP-binding protein
LNPLLRTENITKQFPGVTALKDINFSVNSGEVHAIVGENGAGKSTLMNILAGVYHKYEGKIYLDEQPVIFNSTGEARDHGIAIIHQELNLIPYLDISENIYLGRERVTPYGTLDKQRMYHETSGLLKKLDLNIDPQKAMGDLRVGQQQLIEIAKALSQEARIIIMDEPTSALSEHEIDILFAIIKSLKEREVTIIYITHKLNELYRIADRITILRDGYLIDAYKLSSSINDEQIIKQMVGRELKNFYIKQESVIGQNVLSVENLNLKSMDGAKGYSLKDINFSVKRGEVLGIYGLMGAGRSELLEALFGLHPNGLSGKIVINGEEKKIRSPRDAIASRLGMVPEDRKEQGLLLQMSVGENICLACPEKTERYGILNRELASRLAAQYIGKLNIKITSLDQIVENLSGGNQQKTVIAKWLATDPLILLLDEPTRGIDVNAKNEIYSLISDLARAGLALIIVSSELSEIIAISDTILVLSEGRLTGVFTADGITEETIVRAAIPKGADKNSSLSQEELTAS